jgi:hypothetical protein
VGAFVLARLLARCERRSEREAGGAGFAISLNASQASEQEQNDLPQISKVQVLLHHGRVGRRIISLHDQYFVLPDDDTA